MKTAVVGHHEWVEFLRVDHVPGSGEILHASEAWELPAGGGPAAAIQLLKLSGDTMFFTALGDDELGHRAFDELTAMGLDVKAAFRPEPTRRAITHIDRTGERTITVVGKRLEPFGSDDLDWSLLDAVGAAYFTAGDGAALQHARSAAVLVATARMLPQLAASHVSLDALVGSDLDPAEAYAAGDIEPAPGIVVRTRGGDGGTFQVRDEGLLRYVGEAPPDPIVDRYGAGDAFAGALTFALGLGHPADRAVELAARCGAAVLSGRGPYQGQLTAADLGL